jgi:hypothetical protein
LVSTLSTISNKIRGIAIQDVLFDTPEYDLFHRIEFQQLSMAIKYKDSGDNIDYTSPFTSQFTPPNIAVTNFGMFV